MNLSFLPRFCFYLALIFFQAFTAVANNCAAGGANDPLTCLACNCYYEARGEGTEGMIAVTKTVLTRTRMPSYPSSACKVIYQDVQFSWTGRKVVTGKGLHRRESWVKHESIPPVPQDHECHQIAKAYATWDGMWADSFYNFKKTDPRWARSCTHIQTIGDHRFVNCRNTEIREGSQGNRGRKGVR